MPTSRNSGSEEEDGAGLFRRAAGAVRPLRAEARVSAPQPRPLPRRRASGPAATIPPPLVPTWENPVSPPECPEPSFHRGGLQLSVLKRLRRGSLRPEARLDLHGMTLAEAGERLAGFLAECRAHGLRHVLIIHGKGSRSPGGRPVLKPQTLRWLRQNPAVLALEPAQPPDGGEGAVYALLKRG